MKTARFIRMGRLGVVLGLCVACEGKMRSLGEREGTGDTGTSYVQAPTLPIDPTCACASPNQICNADRQCVPRCDAAGRCALWLSPVAVKDLYVDGSTVYFLTVMAYDLLGNPLDGGSLYRAEYPNDTPTLVASGIQDPESILGRYNGATFVATANASTGGIIQISNAGKVTSITSDINYYSGISMRGNWIAYTDSSRMNLLGIDLDRDLVPQLLVDSTTTASLSIDSTYGISSIQVLDDSLWFAAPSSTSGQYRLCYLNRSDLRLGLTCHDVSDFFRLAIHSTNGSLLFYSIGMVPTKVESMDITGKHLLTLFSGAVGSYGQAAIWEALYLDGWLYSFATEPMQLVRYPTTVGRLPQEVLPASVGQPAFFPETARVSAGDFAVGSAGLFWFQAMDLNQPQYIFHAPLPPQPCDAGLPCAESN